MAFGQRSPNGWRIPVPLVVLAYVILVPTLLASALLTISFFWTVFGAPIFVVAVLATRALRIRGRSMATRPSELLLVLGGLEVFGAAGFLALIPSIRGDVTEIWWLLPALFGPGLTTTALGLAIARWTTALSPPPPPGASSAA